MLEHLGGDDAVELAVGERHGERVAFLDVGLGAVGDLARILHGAEPLADLGQLVGVLVEGEDIGAAAVRLERVAAGARTHVEDPFAGLEAQAIKVDGQHRVPSGIRRSRPRRPRPWLLATARQLKSCSTRALPAAP